MKINFQTSALIVLLATASVRFAAAQTSALSGTAAQFATLLASHKADGPNARQQLLNKKLLEAVTAANLDDIRRLASMGADVNAHDDDNFSPLVAAVLRHGDPATITLLLDLGAQVDLKNACDTTALHFAAEEGRLQAAKILVEHHAAVDAQTCLGATPLVEAAHSLENGQVEVFSYLLGLGANPNATNDDGESTLLVLVNTVRTSERNDMLGLILADKRTNVNAHGKDGMTALKYAVKANDVNTVKLLLQVPGIDVNDNAGGTTALFLADLDQFGDISKLLRAAGANGTLRAARRR